MNSEQRDVAAGIRWTLQGDGGVRALIAWHYGWEPAKQASGTEWMSPFLNQLLNDDYAAVRLIASRSLKRLPGFETFAYDPVPGSKARAPVQLPFVGNLPAGRADQVALLFNGGRVDTNRIARLLEARDRKIVRLRE